MRHYLRRTGLGFEIFSMNSTSVVQQQEKKIGIARSTVLGAKDDRQHVLGRFSIVK